MRDKRDVRDTCETDDTSDMCAECSVQTVYVQTPLQSSVQATTNITYALNVGLRHIEEAFQRVDSALSSCMSNHTPSQKAPVGRSVASS